MKTLILAAAILTLLRASAFADTNETETSIRAKMFQQITNWTASHGGASVTYEHISIGYGTVLDATMTFVTGDGLKCEKIGFNIAVCQDSTGQTVALPERASGKVMSRAEQSTGRESSEAPRHRGCYPRPVTDFEMANICRK